MLLRVERVVDHEVGPGLAFSPSLSLLDDLVWKEVIASIENGTSQDNNPNVDRSYISHLIKINSSNHSSFT